MKTALQKTMFIALCTTGAAVMAQEFKGKIFNSETGEVVTGAEVQIFPENKKLIQDWMANLNSKIFLRTIHLHHYLQPF